MEKGKQMMGTRTTSSTHKRAATTVLVLLSLVTGIFMMASIAMALPGEWNITVAPSVNGTITPGASGVATVAAAANATFTITPNVGWHVASINNNGAVITTTTQTFVVGPVTSDRTFAATFAPSAPVYRFFQLKQGSHFYTSDEAEKTSVQNLLSKKYRYEGVGFWLNTQATSMIAPLYRFYNVKTGVHFFTASLQEKLDVEAKYPTRYKYEGVAYNVSGNPADQPVWRFYNRKAGTHFYTSNPTEKANVQATMTSTFTYEGVGYYLAK